MAKPRRKGKRIIFVLEIFILLLLIGGLFVYGQINAKLNKISVPEPTNFNRESVAMNETAPELTGYTNLALFALDHRSKTDAGGENSDTMIIASIDNDTKAVKLVSVYRDTLLDVGDDTYQKCNAAYSYGGPQQALSMLNTNLDMNIRDYVTVDFKAMVVAIDMLGGLDIPLSYAEIVHMNNYCVETSEETDTDYTPIELPEVKPEDESEDLDVYHLNGVQATSFCRIRYTAGLDFERTERQREVIQLMVQKAKKSSISTLMEIMDEVFPYVETSLTKSEIMKMGVSMLSYSIDETTGFPVEKKMVDLTTAGSVVIPDTLESNVATLHKFLFPTKTYTASAEVKRRSETILQLAQDETSISNLQKAMEDENFSGFQITPDPNYSYQDPTGTDWGTTGGTDWGTTGGTDWGTGGGTDWGGTGTGTGGTDWGGTGTGTGGTDWGGTGTGTGGTDWGGAGTGDTGTTGTGTGDTGTTGTGDTGTTGIDWGTGETVTAGGGGTETWGDGTDGSTGTAN